MATCVAFFMPLHLGPFDRNVYLDAELSNPETLAYATQYPNVSEQLAQEVQGAKGIGIYKNGLCIGGAYVDDEHFFHVSVLPQFHGVWAFVFGQVLNWAWSVAHPLNVIVSKQNTKVMALFRSVNFVLVGGNKQVAYYQISRRT